MYWRHGKPLYQFSNLVKKQGRCSQCSVNRLANTLKSDADPDLKKKLETCLNACLDSIDWTAAKAAFEVTLFGLLTTVYSGVKWLVLKVSPTQNSYYGQACTLLDLAELGVMGKRTHRQSTTGAPTGPGGHSASV